eukprot:CAMPEP_0113471824 /NCGR_PEP_ID=MMETSP0014_2-20120614/17182_1 /TAXON_ID=2857 /ORGANISM="Nitzschia sp." /LENGTH=236 /DNA_ID=CAMNT_0000364481 /DNA_START=185 /DNA_END=895 /DNA_ORIENTATION=- /assembly_acc=CAM_ASM_000159
MTGCTEAVVENPTNKDVATEKEYWQAFYTKVSTIPAVPSQFCVLVATEVDGSTPIVEFGCGNGRDSEYFSSRGMQVFGSDLCKDAIAKNNEEKSTHGAQFFVCDCTDKDDVGVLIDKARSTAGTGTTSNVVVYNRFFLHSIDAVQEEKFLRALGENMVEGDKLYMEFRCELDEALPKVYGKSHYRRYVVTSKLVGLLRSVGFEIEYERTGQGMAKYKNEDPFISRVVAVKNETAQP